MNTRSRFIISPIKPSAKVSSSVWELGQVGLFVMTVAAILAAFMTI